MTTKAPATAVPGRAPARAHAAAMATVHTVADLRAALDPWRRRGYQVGMVPTMGALHAGHMALVARARAECDRVVATLFVNPTQFNDTADLAGYPRDAARDTAMFAAAGVDILFAPSAAEVYPPGFATTVSVAGLSDCLCGATRPGHLDGVATVVAKLLCQALPARAYFGEKDYQQLLVVARMVQDLNIPTRIVPMATVRAADGLALSSRNRNLSPAERAQAPALYHTLTHLAARLAGGAPAAEVLEGGRAALAAAGFGPIDYLDLRDGTTLEALDRAGPGARLFAAATLGETRLIDNLAVA